MPVILTGTTVMATSIEVFVQVALFGWCLPVWGVSLIGKKHFHNLKQSECATRRNQVTLPDDGTVS